VYMKSSYEKPNSKTLNANINRGRIYLILLLNQMLCINISEVEKFIVTIWPRISLLSKIIKMIYKAVILSAVLSGFITLIE
jgi:hypothetical protein